MTAWAPAAAVVRVSDGVHPDRDELIALRPAARGLPLRSRVAARSSVGGDYRSGFRGRGMDYFESRAYQAGDDIRTMDWRVTARTGRAHVKVYHEERERPVVVMADFGPAMFFATQGAFKTLIAARAAALIAWAAVDNGDRIGALLYNGAHLELRPAGGRRGALRLIHALVAAAQPNHTEPGHTGAAGDTLGAALRRLRRVARPGSLIFLFSDFYVIGDDTKAYLQNLRRHHDVIACQILDRLELEPPPPGRYPVQYAVPLIRLNTGDDVAGALRQALGRAARPTAGLAA
jgi:uncharacterized protein (DUF58 family)